MEVKDMRAPTREERIEAVRKRRDGYIEDKARQLCHVNEDHCLRVAQTEHPFFAPQEMSPGMYQALAPVLLMQYYAEWHGAIQYRRALQKGLPPNERAYAAFARIVEEEFGHARMLWHGTREVPGPLDVLEVDPTLFLADTPEEQTGLLRIFQHPGFTNWPEVVMYGHLQDRSAAVQLADFATGLFAPWSLILKVIDGEEQFHIRHGERWIQKIAELPEGRHALQNALNRLFPHAMDVFGRPGGQSKTEKLLVQYRLKHKTNDEARLEFVSQVEPLIIACNLELPHWVFKSNRPF